MIDVARPVIALEERELASDSPPSWRVVRGGYAIFAKNATCTTSRPLSLVAMCNIGGVEIYDVVGDANVLGLPQAAIPPV